ncbi:threonine synthase, partial [Gammaproteobacteria bacterium]|nr:threonine synthase [Gammaproteobacteria bacterium]
ENDILHRFFSDNNYSKQFVHETISPSMDISVASNFERLVYDLFLNRDSAKCFKMFDNFPVNPIKLDPITWQKKDHLFSSSKVNDLDTKKIIQETHRSFNYILDPHTAVAAVEAFDKSDENNHYVVLSTAHPAKFPKIYEELDIEINSLPFALRDLFKKEEYLHSFDADYNQIANFINRNN